MSCLAVNHCTSTPEESKTNETQANKKPKTNKKETTIERCNPLDSEILEWLQEFRENLVDDEIPLQGGSHASSSHEASLEPTTRRREDLGKHSVHAHFPGGDQELFKYCKKIPNYLLQYHRGEQLDLCIFGAFVSNSAFFK